jgi:beta-lactamase regulating signal transducer with metallopeptidase domain
VSWDVLVDAALKSLAVSSLALLLLRLAGRRCAAERAWIAHVGILLALLAPVLATFGPDLEVAWLNPPAAPATEAAAVPSLTAPTPEPARFATVPTSAVAPPSGLSLLAVTYGVVAGVLLLGLVLAIARLVLLQRRAAVLTDQTWLSALAHAQQRMGFKHGAALLVSDDIASPVSWGFFRPTIVLNSRVIEAGDQAEAVIAHELAHVVRLDWANLILARMGAALLWFNPLVWILAREAHQLREEAADDAVLRGAVPGPDYASLLLGVARHENRGALLAAHGVAPGKHSLKRRLVRVLDPDVPRHAVKPGWRAGAGVAALAAAGLVAAFTPVPVATPMREAQRAELAAEAAFHSAPASAAAAEDVTAAIDTPVAETTPAALSEGEAEIATAEAEAEAEAAIEAKAEADMEIEALADAQPAPAAGSATLAMHAGSRRISPEQLTALRIHGATPEWLRALEAEAPNLRDADPDKLIGLAVHKVRPEWLRELRALGYRDLNADQITNMKVHGVSAAYVRELAASGYRDIPVDQLVSMRIHGVDPDFARSMVGPERATEHREPPQRPPSRDAATPPRPG